MKSTAVYFVLFLKFFIIAESSFVKDVPDAIRCGTYDQGFSAIFFVHSTAWDNLIYYCQVYAGDVRCIVFKKDGSYHSGSGYYDTRKACDGKSLNQLKAQNRTFQLTDQSSVRQKFVQVQKQMNDKLNHFEQRMLKIEADYENKIKAQNEKIVKLEQELNKLKNRQSQRPKENSKECKELTDRRVAQTQRIQKLEKQVNENQKEFDQKVLNTQKKFAKMNKELVQRVEQLQKKFKLIHFDELSQKTEQVLQRLSKLENLNMQLRLPKIQKQTKDLKADLLKKYTNLENQINKYCNEEKQNQIQCKSNIKGADDQKRDAEGKIVGNLRQDIEAQEVQSLKSTPEP